MMEKAKIDQSYGLHQTPFIFMWMSIPIVSIGVVYAIALSLHGLRYSLPIVGDMLYWLSQDGLWLTWLLIGIGMGIITSISQAWLIRQRYGFVPRLWHLMTMIGWVIVGIIVFASIKYENPISSNETSIYLFFAWFATVPIVQTLSLWFHLRKAAFLWLFAAIASGLISVIAYQVAPRYDEFTFAHLYGTLAQTFLTAITLIFLMARQRRLNINEEALALE